MRRSEPGRAGGGHHPQPRVPAGEGERAAVGRPRRPRVARPGADHADELRGRRRVDRDLAREPVDRRPRRRHQAAVGRDGGIPQLVPGVGGHEALAGEVGVGRQQADPLLERRGVGGLVAQQAAAEPVRGGRRARDGVAAAAVGAGEEEVRRLARGRDPARERRQRLGDRLDRGELPAVRADLRDEHGAAAVWQRARDPPAPAVQHVRAVAERDPEARAVTRRRQPRVDRASVGRVVRQLGPARAVGRHPAQVREAAVDDRVAAAGAAPASAATVTTRTAARLTPVDTRAGPGRFGTTPPRSATSSSAARRRSTRPRSRWAPAR